MVHPPSNPQAERPPSTDRPNGAPGISVWLVYLFVELKTGAAIASLVLLFVREPLESVSKDTDRDFILNAEQAQEYGAVDEIITSRKTGPELAVAAAGGS